MPTIEKLLSKTTNALAAYESALSELSQALRNEQQPQMTIMRLQVTHPQKRTAALNDLDREIKGWLYARSIPNDILRPNIYLIPTSLIAHIHNRLERYSAERAKLTKTKTVEWTFVSTADLKIRNAVQQGFDEIKDRLDSLSK